MIFCIRYRLRIKLDVHGGLLYIDKNLIQIVPADLENKKSVFIPKEE